MPDDLTTMRNYVQVNDRLASAGQIAYNQIPQLRKEGYEIVINLAVADEERNAREGFLVTESGLSYFHIPVEWERPTLDDLELFFHLMEASKERKVFVHCFANMRVSAFVYLYRTLVLGVPEEEARPAMDAVWDPMEREQWAGLIRKAQATYGSTD